MCQVPAGRVVAVGEKRLTIEYNGKRRELRSILPGIKVGDYVSFSLDMAIDRIDEEEAKAAMGAMR
jgi:hydrogenase maturation factor